MIKIKELKQLIIKGEIEFIEQVQHEDPKMYIDGIKAEINECDDINDILEFYGNHGFELKIACKIIIDLLMNSAQLKEKL